MIHPSDKDAHKNQARNEINSSPEALIDAENFYQAQLRVSEGPQIEGVIREDSIRVVQDAETLWTTVDGVRVPVLFRIECDSLAHRPYFEKRGGIEGVYVLSPTVNLVDESGLEQIEADIISKGGIRELIALRRIDSGWPDDNLSRLLLRLGADHMHLEPMLDAKSSQPAEVIHYSGLPRFHEPLEGHGGSINEVFYEMVDEGILDLAPISGTTVIRPETLTDDMAEKIWQIYDKQLDILIEDHPAYQRLDKELIESILSSPTGFNIVHFEEGEPVCIFLGVTELEECEWLNARSIYEEYGEDDVLYCPAMVTNFEKQGLNYSANIFSLLVEIAMRRGKNIRPYFECTDISAQYIPKILENAIEDTGHAVIEIAPKERYMYVSLKSDLDD